MQIYSFKGIGDFEFDDSLEIIKEKLSNYKKVEYGSSSVLEKEYPSILIHDISTYIVFSEDSSRVRYFEVETDIFHKKINLYKEKKSVIKRKYMEDDDCIVDDDDEGTLNIEKYGFSITKIAKGNRVFIYSKEYLDEDDISEDDMINFYLGLDS